MIPDLERITFFAGQRLSAADLTALQTRQRELRWLHNRTLHTWGIATGLGVEGHRGDTAVTVEPGYGTDDQGREIALAEPRTLEVPAVASDGAGKEAVFYLVAAWVHDSGQDVLETRQTRCHPVGAVRLDDEPRVDWRRADQLQPGRELVLAKAWVRNCRLSRELSTSVRREVRPSLVPYVAAGRTAPGGTPWSAWAAGGQMLGVKVTVSTAAARFRRTPRYLVELGGERFLAESPGPLVALGVPSVASASRTGFTVQVLVPKSASPLVNPSPLRKASTAPAIVRDQLGWHVVWAGIED